MEEVSALVKYGEIGVIFALIIYIGWWQKVNGDNIKDTAKQYTDTMRDVIAKHDEQMCNRDAKIEGLSISINNANKENNRILAEYAKVIGNHIDHNTDQMKESIQQRKEDAVIIGELRDAVNQLVGFLNKK